MELQRQHSPNDHDFYIMELDPGIYVDGKKKGNLSRFINHSCDPNCELSVSILLLSSLTLPYLSEQRWLVKGRTRIGIFALREIACGEPLSYDYQFDTQVSILAVTLPPPSRRDKETDAFKCHCGSSKCRGTMAPRQKIISKENLSRSDRQKLIARGKKREDKSVLQVTLFPPPTSHATQREEWKRSFTGKNLPGDGVLEIKNGPSKATFEEGRESRVFLVRNVLCGLNFLQRRELMWRRADRSAVAAADAARKKRKRSTQPAPR
jgi:hypothetical protein